MYNIRFLFLVDKTFAFLLMKTAFLIEILLLFADRDSLIVYCFLAIAE